MSVSFYLPIYSDEVATKIYHSRLFDEGLANWINGLPQCAKSFHTPLPVTFLFGALLSSLTYYNADPVQIRVIGILNVPILAALFVYLIRKLSAGKVSYLEAAGGVGGLLGLGVLPLLLIINRPEQILILCLIFFLVAPLFAAYRSPRVQLAISGLFIAVTSIFYFSHPLAIFFTPFVIVSGGYLAWRQTKRIATLVVLFGIIAGTAFQSYHYAKDITQCDDAPIVSAIMRSGTLDPHLLVTNPGEFFWKGVRNVLTASPEVISRAIYAKRYQSDWLPQNPTLHDDYLLMLVDSVAAAIFAFLLYGTMFLVVTRVVYCVRQRSIDQNTSLALALAVGLYGHEFFYVTWNFYTASLVICVSLLVSVLLIPSLSLSEKLQKRARQLFWVVMITSLFSQVELLKTTLPQLAAIPAGSTRIAAQPLSIPVNSYQINREKIYQAGEACHIDKSGENSRIVVDEFTSFAYLRAKEPILISYISGFFGQDIAEDGLAKFLKSTGSAGLITRCSSLPQGLLRNGVHQVGNFCCIGYGFDT